MSSSRRISVRLMIKNTFVLLCAVVMCVLMLPRMEASAAENGSCGDNLTWTYNGGRLTVSGSGAMTNFSDNNMPPWYKYADEITSAVIEEGVTTIGELTFFDCKSLANVVLPSTLREIGIRAFKGCVSLAYLNLPGNVFAISESAFENCASLNGIRLEEGITVIGDKAFYRCSSLTSIIIPESVDFFGMVVFAYCENLIRADIRCPIEKLPDWTFYGCNNLTAVGLPDSLTNVGSLAFYNCPSLTTIYYKGEVVDNIYDQIVNHNDDIISNGGIVQDDVDPNAGTASENNEDNEVSHTTVIESDNSIITVGDTVSYDEDYTPTIREEEIVVTIVNEDGWNELEEVLDEIIERVNDSNNGLDPGASEDVPVITVTVQIPDSTVPGEFISEYAGENIIVEFTTSDGSSWQIDMSQVDKEIIGADEVYDFSYVLKDIEESIEGIDSVRVYGISF